MASTYSDRLKLELQAADENSGIWGANTNVNLETIDKFTSGYLSKSVAGSSNVTLTSANASPTSESSNKVIEFTGALTANIHVFIPAVENNYIFFNNTTGSFTLTVAPDGHGSNGVAITQGAHTIQYCTGDTVVDLFANSLGQLSVKSEVKVGDNITLRSNGQIVASSFNGDGGNLTGLEEFPAGTKALFVQNAAPTGFTRDTTAGLNNTTLDIVTGTGGGTRGGSDTFTTVFAATTANGSVNLSASNIDTANVSGSTGNTTISTPTLSSHSHGSSAGSTPRPNTNQRAHPNNSTYNIAETGGGSGTSSTGGGGAHSHPVSGNVSFNGTISQPVSFSVPNMTLKYVDNIIASKD